MIVQQSAFEYLQHGQTPFFRLPTVRPDDAHHGLGTADAVLIGVPYDGGSTYQPGARLAPYHVRRVSALVQGFHPWHAIDVFSRVRALDGGNVVVPPFDGALAREAIRRDVGAIVAAGAVPFVVGGDHTVALPALRAVAERHGPLAVVHVDAHLDTSGPEVWGDAHHHGTPLRHALVEGLIERGQLCQVGIRATWGSPTDGDLGDSFGVWRCSIEEFALHGVGQVAAEIRERVGNRPVYLTFDIDAVDPAFAPGTGTPVPGGLSSRQAIDLVRGLAGLDLVGMDLVEVLPALDHADITSHLAATLLFEGLAVLALARRRRGVHPDQGNVSTAELAG